MESELDPGIAMLAIYFQLVLGNICVLKAAMLRHILVRNSAFKNF